MIAARSPRFSDFARFTGASILFGAFAAGSACTTPATELVAGMTTQIQVPKELQAVGVVVRYGGTLISCRSYPLADGTVTLPSTLGLVPQEGREGALEPVTVTVLGFHTEAQGQAFDDNCVAAIPGADSPEVVVIRSKRMPYITDRILFLPMPLKESCNGVVCPEDETCIGGLCESNEVDPATVVDYSDPLVFGNTNTCFSAGFCLPGGITQPAILDDLDTCTFHYPIIPGAPELEITPGNLNVEIIYQSFGTEILDLDDKEGFVLPDPENPLTFRLAGNLCESNFKNGKILGVYAAPICPAKPALQPICDDDMAAIQAGERSPLQEAPGPQLCTIGTSLTPSESALYVLLDRSKSMSTLFDDPAGVDLAVGVPLRNPISARTSLAFSFLPADVCDDSVYRTPDFGFDDVEKVRQPIAAALSDPSTVLSTDPVLNLDSAMNGAYTALAALDPVESARFNRRALIIVGNRDLVSECGATPAATLAQDAKDAGIFTYVAVLDAPTGAEQFNDPDPQQSAADIATAGGTTVFDAIAHDEDGVLAVQKVFNDLGSCVYDPPSDFVQANAQYLSYVNPVSLERADIPRKDDCDGEAASTTVDGWGLEPDGAVRICGVPCETLRATLTDVAKSFGALGEPAPQVPIVASLPCLDPHRFDLGN